MSQPLCGRVQAVTPSFVDFLLGLLALLGAVATAVSAFDAAKVIAAVAASLGMTLIGFFAVLGALFVVVVIVWFLVRSCGAVAGTEACWSGVVVAMRRAFSSAWDYILPFRASPDRADVLVRERYWPILEGGAALIHCYTDELRSPLLRCFFRTPRLCAAIRGALIGAIVGAAIVAAAAILLAAALGCGLLLPLCLAFALLAFLVGALIALIGAAIGGNIARSRTERSDMDDSHAHDLSLGDLVTMRGNVVRRNDYGGARVAWFVTNLAQHGSLPPEGLLPLSYLDVEDRFADIGDACGGGS